YAPTLIDYTTKRDAIRTWLRLWGVSARWMVLRWSGGRDANPSAQAFQADRHWPWPRCRIPVCTGRRRCRSRESTVPGRGEKPRSRPAETTGQHCCLSASNVTSDVPGRKAEDRTRAAGPPAQQLLVITLQPFHPGMAAEGAAAGIHRPARAGRPPRARTPASIRGGRRGTGTNEAQFLPGAGLPRVRVMMSVMNSGVTALPSYVART